MAIYIIDIFLKNSKNIFEVEIKSVNGDLNYMQNKKYLVTVIMSTYNGQEYLEEQLESLLNQIGVKINLVVRDDGSKDSTVNILKKYSNKFHNLVVFSEINIGATASFHKAAHLAMCEKETDYYAFCDQDDIWEEDKLITAINKLSLLDQDFPVLYYSNLMMVDNNGKKLGMLLNDSLICSSYNALAAIYTYGCTCVFNRVALSKFCKLSHDFDFIYHDNWMYSVCMFLGFVVYDPDSKINYRQTGKNVSGNKKTGIAVWGQRFSKILKLNKDKRIYENIALSLINNFEEEIVADDLFLLKKICNYRFSLKDKFFLIFSKRMKTGNLSKDVCIVGRILLNKL